MKCEKCGSEISDNQKFCVNCGAKVDNQKDNNVNNTNNTNQTSKDDTKIYKILSYIGILWLVGLLSSKVKEDKSVKFHVGQGMIITIVYVIVEVVVQLMNNLVIANIFKEKLWGITIGVSPTGLALMSFLNFAVVIAYSIFEIIGIVNVCKGQDKELPIIGEHAFYK